MNGPKNMHSRVTSYHASATDVITLVNQNHLVEHHSQARLGTANQNEL